MSQVTTQSTFVPYSTLVVPIIDDALNVVFQTRKDPDQTVECDHVIYLTCQKEGIENLIEATIIWKTGCGNKDTISSDDPDTFFTITLLPDNLSPITSILLEVDISKVSNRNDFELWGTIEGDGDDLKTLLARGIIYSEI